MKQRKGFVSNSSSSSFIVLMGKSFNPTVEEIQDAISDSGYDYEKVTVESIKNCIEAVKDGYLSEYDNYRAYSVLSELCNRTDIVLVTIDVGSDRGSITNILSDERKEKLQKALKELE